MIAQIRAKAFQRSPVPQVSSIPKEVEENYEMSDHDEDSDDSEASRRRAKKKVPNWAKKENFVPALEKQLVKDFPIDPDELFGEVETCDLEAIFPDRKLKNYKRRGSSGNWERDGVTAKEKRRYKQQLKNIMS